MDNDDDKFNQVPADFPRPEILGAVSGAAPKLLLTNWNGKFYVPGCTPPEIYERWQVCEDLIRQLAERSLLSKTGKRSHMTELEILEQYYERLLKTRWTSDAEACWIMRNVAMRLEWPCITGALK